MATKGPKDSLAVSKSTQELSTSFGQNPTTSSHPSLSDFSIPTTGLTTLDTKKYLNDQVSITILMEVEDQGNINMDHMDTPVEQYAGTSTGSYQEASTSLHVPIPQVIVHPVDPSTTTPQGNLKRKRETQNTESSKARRVTSPNPYRFPKDGVPGDDMFLQRFGTAMGTKMAPKYANIHMGEFVNKTI